MVLLMAKQLVADKLEAVFSLILSNSEPIGQLDDTSVDRLVSFCTANGFDLSFRQILMSYAVDPSDEYATSTHVVLYMKLLTAGFDLDDSTIKKLFTAAISNQLWMLSDNFRCVRELTFSAAVATSRVCSDLYRLAIDAVDSDTESVFVQKAAGKYLQCCLRQLPPSEFDRRLRQLLLCALDRTKSDAVVDNYANVILEVEHDSKIGLISQFAAEIDDAVPRKCTSYWQLIADIWGTDAVNFSRNLSSLGMVAVCCRLMENDSCKSNHPELLAILINVLAKRQVSDRTKLTPAAHQAFRYLAANLTRFAEDATVIDVFTDLLCSGNPTDSKQASISLGTVVCRLSNTQQAVIVDFLREHWYDNLELLANMLRLRSSTSDSTLTEFFPLFVMALDHTDWEVRDSALTAIDTTDAIRLVVVDNVVAETIRRIATTDSADFVRCNAWNLLNKLYRAQPRGTAITVEHTRSLSDLAFDCLQSDSDADVRLSALKLLLAMSDGGESDVDLTKWMRLFTLVQKDSSSYVKSYVLEALTTNYATFVRLTNADYMWKVLNGLCTDCDLAENSVTTLKAVRDHLETPQKDTADELLHLLEKECVTEEAKFESLLDDIALAYKGPHVDLDCY